MDALASTPEAAPAPIRTLLIDNYDSYTYNLYQLLAEVCGIPPVVIRNDQYSWSQLKVHLNGNYDNIVISPGPGNPKNSEDFGVCGDVIRYAELPVLGVCLGHQGICLASGGKVVNAPQVAHGRVSTVEHNETAFVLAARPLPLLFGNIPSPFNVVRYHSLAVDAAALPEDMEAFAWSSDGVIMAARHKTRPLWGVQFHPESVCTEHGGTLLANFAAITRAWHEAQGERNFMAADPLSLLHPKPEHRTTEQSKAADEDGRFRVMVKPAVAVGSLASERLFLELLADEPSSFWLDSARVEAGLSRFSYMGSGRGPHSETVAYDVASRTVTVSKAGKALKQEILGTGTTFYDWLQSEIERRRVSAVVDVNGSPVPPLPFDFQTGYVGYFGYELKDESGLAAAMTPAQLQAHKDFVRQQLFPNVSAQAEAETTTSLPTCSFLFADRMVCFDHASEMAYAMCLVEDGDAVDEARQWLDSVCAALQGISGSVHRPDDWHCRACDGPDGATAAPGAGVTNEDSSTRVKLRHAETAYLEDIEHCLRCIHEGESYELCLTTRVSINGVRPDPLELHRHLRRKNPAPYAALLRLSDAEAIVGSSPEKFITIDQQGNVLSKPIKGTRRRGRTPDEDELLRKDLQSNEKDFAENLMIVDLIRNDLGMVCEEGSVRVPRLMNVETYATVHQLVSTVQGKLRSDVTPLACVQACFPPGSMTGAPKLRSVHILECLEQGPRGVYSGAMGFLALNGSVDLNVVIRTVVIKHDQVYIGAGGAIVALSDPDEEYAEMLLKAKAPMQSILHSVGRPNEWTPC